VSFFLGTTSGTNGVGIQCCQDDLRLWPEILTDEFNAVYSIIWTLFMGFENGFWPRGGQLDASGDEMLEADLPFYFVSNFEPYNGGCNTRYGIQGVTLDALGNPLGYVKVKCFRTSDDTKTDETTSDAYGNFMVSTPFYPDSHYLVQYKATSPDVFGSSLNTLVGA
jgi:hypothetical protein